MAPTTPDLSAKYTLLMLSVISSSNISNRTKSLIEHVKSTPADNKPAIVALHAKAAVANKLISIVEIAKRELKAGGQKIYQYNALGSELIELKPATKDAANDDAVSDEEPAFEKIEQKTTVRNVSTVTIYLSLVPVKELKDAYGYIKSFFSPRSKSLTSLSTVNKSDDTPTTLPTLPLYRYHSSVARSFPWPALLFRCITNILVEHQTRNTVPAFSKDPLLRSLNVAQAKHR
ncbi:hypothetical protein D6D05_03744 [Aureobasidium pullulans]|nr:hypothetical protein D6D05_03744 [Aureobasidium pullulans]